jgi:hypothetical protein
MPSDQTIDFVVMFLVVGLLCLGLGSMFVGWVVRQWDQRVNRSLVVMSPTPAQTPQTEQTDTQTDQVSVADRWLDRLEVDRTKTALIELLVYTGWEVGQIRNVVKGDNGAIGTEIEAARQRRGIALPGRELRVRDDKGERLIPM